LIKLIEAFKPWSELLIKDHKKEQLQTKQMGLGAG